MASGTDTPNGQKSNPIFVAIVIPSVIVVALIIFIATTFVMPRMSRQRERFAAIKAERMKQRLEEIDSIIKTQHFYDWLATQKERNGESLLTTDPVCAICLDEFDEDAQVRGLRCRHAFHVHCLDEWFARFNEHCPLCHRTIIPGKRAVMKKISDRPDPIPVTFMV